SGRDGWPAMVAGVTVTCWSLALVGLAVAISSATLRSMSWPDFATALANPAVALLVAHVSDARRWSALTLMSAFFSALNVASTSGADRLSLENRHPPPGGPWAAWSEGWTWIVSIVGFTAIAFFPDSRLPSARWRVAPAALIVGGGLTAAT